MLGNNKTGSVTPSVTAHTSECNGAIVATTFGSAATAEKQNAAKAAIAERPSVRMAATEGENMNTAA